MSAIDKIFDQISNTSVQKDAEGHWRVTDRRDDPDNVQDWESIANISNSLITGISTISQTINDALTAKGEDGIPYLEIIRDAIEDRPRFATLLKTFAGHVRELMSQILKLQAEHLHLSGNVKSAEENQKLVNLFEAYMGINEQVNNHIINGAAEISQVMDAARLKVIHDLQNQAAEDLAKTEALLDPSVICDVAFEETAIEIVPESTPEPTPDASPASTPSNDSGVTHV